jgi:hypothetical protein
MSSPFAGNAKALEMVIELLILSRMIHGIEDCPGKSHDDSFRLMVSQHA